MIKSISQDLNYALQSAADLRVGRQGLQFTQQFKTFQDDLSHRAKKILQDVGDDLDTLAAANLARLDKNVRKIYKSIDDEMKVLKSNTGNVNKENRLWRANTADILQNMKGVLGVYRDGAKFTKAYADDALKASANWRKHFESMTDGLDNVVGRIPLIGQYLSSSRLGLDKLADKMEITFKDKLLQNIQNTATGGKVAFKDMFSAAGAGAKVFGKVLMKALPILAIAGLVMTILKLFTKAFSQWKEMDEAAESFRRSTGLFKSQMAGLPGIVQSVYLRTRALGATYEDIYEAAGALTKEWGHIRVLTEENIRRLVVYNKGLGISDEVTAKAQHNLVQYGNATMDQAANIQDRMIAMTLSLGMNANDVMSDLADVSEDVAGWFGGYGKGLANAVIQARKLGVSLSSVTSLAEHFLDFEGTIQSEMQLSAILGRRVSFEKAREAAMQGRPFAVQGEVIHQLGGAWSGQNMLVKKMIADAAGMSIGEMMKIMTAQQQANQVPPELRNVYNIIQNLPDDMKAIFNTDQMQGTVSGFQNVVEAMLQAILSPIVHFVSVQMPRLLKLTEILIPSFMRPKNALQGTDFQAKDWHSDLLALNTSSAKMRSAMQNQIAKVAGNNSARFITMMNIAQAALPLVSTFDAWSGKSGTRTMADILRQALGGGSWSQADINAIIDATYIGAGKPMPAANMGAPALSAAPSSANLVWGANSLDSRQIAAATRGRTPAPSRGKFVYNPHVRVPIVDMRNNASVNTLPNTGAPGIPMANDIAKQTKLQEQSLEYNKWFKDNSDQMLVLQQNAKQTYTDSLRSELANPLASIVRFVKYSTTLLEHLVNKQMVTALKYLFIPAASLWKANGGNLWSQSLGYNPENAMVYSAMPGPNNTVQWTNYMGDDNTQFVAGKISNTAGFTMPRFARGGIVNSGQLAIVGENGPEIVALPKNATVFPNPSAVNKNASSANATINVEAIVSALQELISITKDGHTIEIDGNKVAKAIAKSRPTGMPLAVLG